MFSLPADSENSQISAEVTLGLTTAVNGKITSNTMGEDPYILLQSSQWDNFYTHHIVKGASEIL